MQPDFIQGIVLSIFCVQCKYHTPYRHSFCSESSSRFSEWQLGSIVEAAVAHVYDSYNGADSDNCQEAIFELAAEWLVKEANDRPSSVSEVSCALTCNLSSLLQCKATENRIQDKPRLDCVDGLRISFSMTDDHCACCAHTSHPHSNIRVRYITLENPKGCLLECRGIVTSR